MATSGTVTYNLTARKVCDYALKKIGVVGKAQAVGADDMATAIRELEVMLKGWQVDGPNLWRRTTGSQALTANTASYDLTVTTPHRIWSARLRHTDGRDVPLEMLTADEYDELPLKTSTGTPTSYYYDAQRANGTLYIWPVLASVTTETVRYTYQRRFHDVGDENNDLDIPQEYLHLIGYCLADALLDDYGVADTIANRISARAMGLLASANGADREQVVRFEPEWR